MQMECIIQRVLLASIVQQAKFGSVLGNQGTEPKLLVYVLPSANKIKKRSTHPVLK